MDFRAIGEIIGTLIVVFVLSYIGYRTGKGLLKKKGKKKCP